MNGEPRQLVKLIGANNFMIPIYQRPYSWKTEQCEQLMADIEACGRGVRDSHFFGSVVRVPEANASAVIDGQQRITTISLLLLAIRRTVSGAEKVPEQSTVEATVKWVDKFLFDEYARVPGTVKLRHVHGDEVDYKAVVEGKEGDDNLSHMVENFRFFCRSVKESALTVDQLLDGVEKLFVIDITIDKSDNPQLVFESINSTGLDLTEGDKIRNFILMGLDHDTQTRLFRDYWMQIERLVSRGEEDDHVGLFVRDALTSMTGVVPNLKRIYPDFKRFCLDRGYPPGKSEELLSLLLEYAQAYRLLLHPEEMKDAESAYLMSNLNRQECLPAYPFLLDVFISQKRGGMSDAQVVAVLRMVDAYVFSRLMCDLPTNSLNKVFTELNRQTMKVVGDSEGKIAYEDALAYVLRTRIGKAKFPEDGEFINGVVTKPVYEMRMKNRAYLFSRLESGTSKAAVVHGTDDVVFDKICSKEYTVEHVMPQTLTADWRRSLGPRHADIWAKWIHTIGNLTLTAYNTELGNKNFAAKSGRTLEELKADEFGFASEANHLFLNKYISEQVKWTDAEIETRARMLAKRAVSIWEYPVTTYEPPEPDVFHYSLLEHASQFFTGSKPLSFVYAGDTYTVDSWHDLVFQACKAVYAHCRSAFEGLAASDHAKNKTTRVSSKSAEGMTQIGDGVFVRCGGSAWDKCQTVRHVLEGCMAGDIEINFSSEIEEEES